MDAESGGYFATAADYIHLNPVRAGLVGVSSPLESYAWSSYPLLIGPPGNRPGWLCGERVLENCGSHDDAEGRDSYRWAMEERRRSGDDGYEGLRRGWCHGGEEFRREMMEVAARTPEKSPEWWSRAHHEAAAEEDLARLLKAFGILPGELLGLRKKDPRKIAMASAMRSRTTVSNEWLARKLHMGSPLRVSRYCGEVERGNAEISR